jgi:hypothetical protein
VRIARLLNPTQGKSPHAARSGYALKIVARGADKKLLHF